MVSTSKDPVLAVVSLSGGNDGMNTVIPYTNPRYRDYRPTLGIPEEMIVPLTDTLGLHPSMAPFQEVLGRGQAGHHPGHRLPQRQPVALPLHGHLGHL